MRRLNFKKRVVESVKKGNDVPFIKLCTLGVAAIFMITVLIVVVAVNLA